MSVRPSRTASCMYLHSRSSNSACSRRTRCDGPGSAGGECCRHTPRRAPRACFLLPLAGPRHFARSAAPPRRREHRQALPWRVLHLTTQRLRTGRSPCSALPFGAAAPASGRWPSVLRHQAAHDSLRSAWPRQGHAWRDGRLGRDARASRTMVVAAPRRRGLPRAKNTCATGGRGTVGRARCSACAM